MLDVSFRGVNYRFRYLLRFLNKTLIILANEASFRIARENMNTEKKNEEKIYQQCF